MARNASIAFRISCMADLLRSLPAWIVRGNRPPRPQPRCWSWERSPRFAAGGLSGSKCCCGVSAGSAIVSMATGAALLLLGSAGLGVSSNSALGCMLPAAAERGRLQLRQGVIACQIGDGLIWRAAFRKAELMCMPCSGAIKRVEQHACRAMLTAVAADAAIFCTQQPSCPLGTYAPWGLSTLWSSPAAEGTCHWAPANNRRAMSCFKLHVVSASHACKVPR